jgi:hypothetical protein
MAPLAAPDWLPMGEVLRAHVTLETGARGLRALFSSEPSDADVDRVKRIGGVAVRLLRSVLSADGGLDADEQRMVAAFAASLGLASEDREALLAAPAGPPIAPADGEIGSKVLRALLRGACLAAAGDGLDPREEEAIRAFATHAGLPLTDVEAARADALAKVEQRRLFGLAAIDYVRAVLRDRVPGPGESLPRLVGRLLLPRRYREEGLSPIDHRSPVTLGGRYLKLASHERTRVLGITWAAALREDPAIGRQALLRARFERVAADLDTDGREARTLASGWMTDVLTTQARARVTPSPDPATEKAH